MGATVRLSTHDDTADVVKNITIHIEATREQVEDLQHFLDWFGSDPTSDNIPGADTAFSIIDIVNSALK